MTANVSYIVAFGGGVASFLSPCVLPIVPAYLSMVTGVDLDAEETAPTRQVARIARDTLLFIAGFAVVFILLGVSTSAIGAAVFRNHLLLTRISGGVVLAMALFLIASFALRLPFAQREFRFHPRPSRYGAFAAPIAGAAFGFGWTPCIGPVLASVLAVAASQRGIGQGALLLAVYAAGLGVPFLLVGCGLGRVASALSFVRRHMALITLASAVLLALFGVLLVLDRLPWVTSELETALRAIGLGRLVTIG